MAGLLDEPYIGYPQLARRRAVPNTDVETSKGLLRGISYYPYDLLGAPIDLMNMAITPLGMGSKTPVMGSDYLQGLAQRAGLSLPKTDSSSENIGRILSSIINPAAGARAVGKVIDPAMQAAAPVGRAVGEQAYRMTEDMLQKQGLMPSITAYHGTPHNIEGAFDISKVGTGEGAQAYGHGMYFAENPKVAETYSGISPTKGSYPSMRRAINGVEVEVGSPEAHAATILSKDGMTVKKAKDLVNSWINEPNAMSAGEDTVNKWKKTLETLNTINKKSDVKDIGLGNLYKVDIPDKDIPNMLDWDKPLSKQPKEVQYALKGIESRFPEIPDFNLRNWMNTDPLASTWHNVLARDLGLEQKEIANILKENGIKGIKYADELSRGKDKGTSNFVVFEPKDVKILEKNSQKVESLLD